MFGHENPNASSRAPNSGLKVGLGPLGSIKVKLKSTEIGPRTPILGPESIEIGLGTPALVVGPRTPEPLLDSPMPRVGSTKARLRSTNAWARDPMLGTMTPVPMPGFLVPRPMSIEATLGNLAPWLGLLRPSTGP